VLAFCSRQNKTN